MGYYVLDQEHNAIPWPDQKMIQWARIHEQTCRERRQIVKQEDIGDNWLSTVFLGLDHNIAYRISGIGGPHIFETMVFGPEREDGYRETADDAYMERYSTRSQALEGHELIAQWMRTGIKPAMKEDT
jgi:hypothetical protein